MIEDPQPKPDPVDDSTSQEHPEENSAPVVDGSEEPVEESVPLAPALPVELEIECQSRVSLAAWQNGFPVVRRVRLRATEDCELPEQRLRLEFDPPLGEAATFDVAALPAGAAIEQAEWDVNLGGGALESRTERTRARVIATLEAEGHEPVHAECEVELLAANEWAGVAAPLEQLASFVLPNAPAVAGLLDAVGGRLKNRTGDGALNGYFSRSRERSAEILRAIYETVQATGLGYVTSPASFEVTGQKVRTPGQVLEHGRGCCLDIAVLQAALAEQCGLHPFLVIVDGHAFHGAWLEDFSLKVASLEDPAALSKRIKLGQALVLDSSPVTQGVEFDEARHLGERELDDPARFVTMVDVHRARLDGVRPLSLSADGTAFNARTETGEQARPLPLPIIGALASSPIDLPDELAEVDLDPREATRLDRWRDRLLDLSLRNKLLNFREGRSSVPFEGLDLPGLEDALADESSFRLLPRAVGGAASPDPEVVASRLREDQADGRLRSRLTEGELEHRLLELYRRSRTSVEETGAITLYLALGVLRWYESSSSQKERRAPLILVPVELIRARGQEPYRLRLAPDETRINGTLLRKLEQDFGLEAPGLEVPPTDAHGIDVQQVLQRFRRMVLEQDRWDVEEHCHLAQFSFSKHLMWLDLEANIGRLKRNQVVHHLFEGEGGFPWNQAPPEEDELDERKPPTSIYAPMAADPSQLQAVVAAATGNSFVLQGPPGTGKSQTITNLIGQLLGEGKSVLFVAEKQAALEVVQRRLEKVGLDPWCLELHSTDTSKRAAIEQLKAPFETRVEGAGGDWQRAMGELQAVRMELNAYADALSRPTVLGATLFEALGKAVELKAARKGKVDWDPGFADEDTVHAQARLVERLRVAGNALGDPAVHPLRDVGSYAWEPDAERQAVKEIEAARGALNAWRTESDKAAKVLQLEPAAHPAEAASRAAVLRGLVDGPALPVGLVLGGAGLSPQFGERVRRARELVDGLRERGVFWEAAAMVFTPAVLTLDLPAAESKYAASVDAIAPIRWIKLSLFGPKKELQRAALDGRLPGPREVLQALREALQVKVLESSLEAAAVEARALFGRAWIGVESDVTELELLIQQAESLRGSCLELAARSATAQAADAWLSLASERREWIGSEMPDGQALRAALATQERWDLDRVVVEQRLTPTEGAWLGSWGDLQERLDRWRENLSAWRDWSALMEATADGRAIGLAPLVEGFLAGDVPREDLAPVLARSSAEALWEQAISTDERLRKFRGFEHEAVVQRFGELDDRHAELARRHVAELLAERVPDLGAPGAEMDLLRRQFQLKRRHRPLRQLFQEMPETLRRLKPVVLMSPLSVARYLDPGIEPFDVVVFDEASQIPPWDAVGAIARGKQVVVVGDSKQLPPTTFFDTMGDEDDEDPDDQDLVELESILDEMVAAGLPQLYLRWHYRSRHESLIAFSNHHYYENRLLTFPSPGGTGDGLGVEWRPIADGRYDRGRTRTNRPEAEAVVAELIRCLEEDPERSVGVVTFSMTQQRLVEDLLDAERAKRPDLEGAFAHEDPPFVKNLENVQGDERDVMLFSIGYGPDEGGRISMNFGAINRSGGERRLNVAVTRAKRRLVVFSTLTAEHLDLDRTRAVGVAHLKSFLAYAARGAAVLNPNLSTPERTTHPGAFERRVASVLRDAGHTVHERIGVSGYRIDLAVVHPYQADRYLIGIECDGRTYYSSRTARERDKGRSQVLGFLGWKLTRVWGVDWWFDPENTRAKLLGEVDSLVQNAVSERAAEIARSAAEEARALAPAEPEGEATPSDGGTNDGYPIEGDPASEAASLEAPSEEDIEAGSGEGRLQAPGVETPEADVTEESTQEAEDAATEDQDHGDAGELPAEDLADFDEPLSVEERLEQLENQPLPPPPFASAFRLPNRRRRGESQRFYDPDRFDPIADQLADLVGEVGPLLREQAYREIIECYGLGTLGKRIRAILDRAVDERSAVIEGDEDGFLWSVGANRDDRQLLRLPEEGVERTEREAEQLPPLEVANAAAWILGRAKTLERQSLVRETAKQFGIVRLGRHVRSAMDRGIERMLTRDGFKVDGDRITLEDAPD